MARSYRHIKEYEEEILRLKAEGKTKREIGELLGFTKDQILKTFLKTFAKRVDFHALKRYNAQKGNGVFGQNAQRPRFISDRQRRLLHSVRRRRFSFFSERKSKYETSIGNLRHTRV